MTYQVVIVSNVAFSKSPLNTGKPIVAYGLYINGRFILETGTNGCRMCDIETIAFRTAKALGVTVKRTVFSERANSVSWDDIGYSIFKVGQDTNLKELAAIKDIE
jgi:hypothetical protein